MKSWVLRKKHGIYHSGRIRDYTNQTAGVLLKIGIPFISYGQGVLGTFGNDFHRNIIYYYRTTFMAILRLL